MSTVKLADLTPEMRAVVLALIAADQSAKEARGRSRPQETTEGTTPSKEQST